MSKMFKPISNTVNIIALYNTIMEKAITNPEDVSLEEQFFICNPSLALAESLLMDFDSDTIKKMAKIILNVVD